MRLPRLRRAWLVVPVLASLVLLGTVTSPLPASAADAGAPVVSRGSGRCLSVDGGVETSGSTVSIQNCDGRAGQAWTYTDPGTAAETLRVFDQTRCLDGGSQVAGTRLVIQPCDGRRSQSVLAHPSGLLQVGTGSCVVVHHAVAAAGTAVELGDCSGTTSTLWRSATLPADTEPPTAPSDLVASDLTCRSVTLTWQPAQDGGTFAPWYDVYHDGQFLESVQGTAGPATFTATVIPGVTWGLYVNARDAAGNVGAASPSVPVTPPVCAADTTPPTSPTGVRALVVGGTGVRVSWSPSTDANGVRYYFVQRDGATVGRLTGTASTATETTFLDSGLAAGSTHTYRVLARDPQFNTSAPSAAASVTVGSGCLVCSVRAVAHDDDLPWGLVALPDGTVLYGRRDADQLVRLDPASGRQTVVAGALPGITGTDGEGGLLGLAVAPTFATDHWLYVMHSTATDDRIVRVQLTGSTLDLGSEQVLLTGIPRNKYHNGGRLRFGPDGKLYAAAGDGQNQSSAQDLSVLGGKILRLDPDGSIPADNPFGTYVWSYGHRNPQGLAFDSHGQLWEQEFGNSAMDETNLIVKGGNYGWPACEGTSGRCSPSYFVAPKKTYQVHVGSCSGIAVVRDVLYVACLRGTRLYREVISGSSLTSTAAYLAGTYGRLRTVEPDIAGKGLWLTTSTAGDKDSIAGNSDETVFHVGLNGTPG
ncbi:MAG TPA: PQQ-dependent sugar dehydrogenase [Friedmanniella sp.]